MVDMTLISHNRSSKNGKLQSTAWHGFICLKELFKVSFGKVAAGFAQVY